MRPWFHLRLVSELICVFGRFDFLSLSPSLLPLHFILPSLHVETEGRRSEKRKNSEREQKEKKDTTSLLLLSWYWFDLMLVSELIFVFLDSFFSLYSSLLPPLRSPCPPRQDRRRNEKREKKERAREKKEEIASSSFLALISSYAFIKVDLCFFVIPFGL